MRSSCAGRAQKKKKTTTPMPWHCSFVRHQVRFRRVLVRPNNPIKSVPPCPPPHEVALCWLSLCRHARQCRAPSEKVRDACCSVCYVYDVVPEGGHLSSSICLYNSYTTVYPLTRTHRRRGFRARTKLCRVRPENPIKTCPVAGTRGHYLGLRVRPQSRAEHCRSGAGACE